MNHEEFESLHTQMKGRIFSFAARRLPLHDAQDVVGETFETAWKNRHKAPEDTSGRLGWTFEIAKLMILRSSQRIVRKHHDHRFAANYPGNAESDPDIAEHVTESLTGWAIYRQLSESDRELFDIAFMNDMTRTEASAILGLSVGAFTTRVSRLRDRIESHLQVADDDAAGSAVGSDA